MFAILTFARDCQYVSSTACLYSHSSNKLAFSFTNAEHELEHGTSFLFETLDCGLIYLSIFK